MTILVTGGAGYIGSHICKVLEEFRIEYIVYDNLSSNFQLQEFIGNKLIIGDILNTKHLASVFKANTISTVIHLAAKKSIAESIQNPQIVFDTNVIGTSNVVEMCQTYSVPNLIFASTAAVYQESSSKISETDIAQPISIYGESKLQAENIIINAGHKQQLNYIIFRFFNVTGSLNETLIETEGSNLIPKILNSILNNSILYVRGINLRTVDGSASRDYVHVGDIAEANLLALKLMENADSPIKEILNLGSSNGMTVMEIVRAVEKLTNKKVVIQRVELLDGEVASLICDSSKAKRTIGWSPKINPLFGAIPPSLN